MSMLASNRYTFSQRGVNEDTTRSRLSRLARLEALLNTREEMREVGGGGVGVNHPRLQLMPFLLESSALARVIPLMQVCTNTVEP